MRKTQISIAIGCCLVVIAVLTWAQSSESPAFGR